MLPGWVGLARFARERNVNPKTMLRHLRALEAVTGASLIRSNHKPGRKPRKYWVHPERARAALERDPDAREAETVWLLTRVENLEKSVGALKKSHKLLKKQVNSSLCAQDRRTSLDIVGQDSPGDL